MSLTAGPSPGHKDESPCKFLSSGPGNTLFVGPQIRHDSMQWI